MANNVLHREKELIERIADGDEIAFARFYEHYLNIVRPFVLRNSPSLQACKEICQMTFLRVWLNRHKLPEIENVKAWIIRISSREYLKYVRDELSKQLTGIELLQDVVESEHMKVEPSFTIREIHALVDKAVSQLSPQRRMIFTLSRKDGLSPAEIAAKLQLSPKTVRNTLSSAMSEVKNYLQSNGYELSLIGCLAVLGYF